MVYIVKHLWGYPPPPTKTTQFMDGSLPVSMNHFLKVTRNNLFPQPSLSSGHSALLSVSFSSFTLRLPPFPYQNDIVYGRLLTSLYEPLFKSHEEWFISPTEPFLQTQCTPLHVFLLFYLEARGRCATAASAASRLPNGFVQPNQPYGRHLVHSGFRIILTYLLSKHFVIKKFEMK